MGLEVKNVLEKIDGVIDVHDLHIWTITSGLDSLSCHILIEDEKNGQDILQEAINTIKDQFNFEHTTIQIENSKIAHNDLKDNVLCNMVCFFDDKK